MMITDFRHTKTLRVGNLLQQDLCAFTLLLEVLHGLADVVLYDVVSQDHADRLITGKVFCQTQSLRDPAFAILIGIVDVFQSEITPIPQQSQEVSGILAPSHYQNFLDSCVDQSLYWIIQHWFVINRKQMLVRDTCKRVQPAAS